MDVRQAIGAGMALHRQGRLLEAAREYERVLAADPAHFDALQLLGLVRLRGGDPSAGLALFDRALAQQPQHAATLNNAGNAWRELGDLPSAIDCYRRAERASRTPKAMVLRNLGSALLEVGELPEATSCLYRALELEQNDAVLWTWVGHLERACHRPERALQAVRRALALDPTLAEAYRGLGSLAVAAQCWPDALRAFERGLELDPGMLVVRAQHYGVAQTIAHWARWSERVAELVEAAERSVQATDPMRLMLALDEPALLRRCGDRMAVHHAERAQPWARSIRTPAPPARARIRVGYLSGDFRDHPVAQLLAGVVERHDREQFDIRCYALGPPAASRDRERIAAASAEFVTLEGVGEPELAARLAADELDVLVDLMGHTEPGVPRVLAARPAPVQVSWLGYPGTLGTGLCDYLIADPVVVPAGSEAWYSESIARMPHCMLPGDRTRVVNPPRSRAEYGLPDKAVVLCCFAQIQKITPATFDAWMATLRACPDAVLWLARPGEEAVANLLREAESRGVAGRRLVFAPRTTDAADHLARYEVADLALDTFPYGSHSTAADAVWVGCPLVALAGRTFQTRVSASVLSAAGAADLVATDFESYAAKLLALASDAPARRRARRTLGQARSASPLFDAGRFAEDLESLYAAMHARRLAGLAPAALGH